MASNSVLGYETITDVVNSYTSLDAQADYIMAANVLARKCPLIKMLPMVASNQIMSNVGARVSYLPTPGTRRFNEGVSVTAAHSTPFTDPICMIEDYSQIDKALWGIQNDPNRYRSDKDMLKMEAMTQKVENELLYGNMATDPGSINGLMTRFNSLTTYPNGDSSWPYNVVSAGGSGGDTTSVLIIEPGVGKCNLIYPKNTVAGIQIEDRGQQTINTNSLASPKYMEALVTHLMVYLGIVVEDERCIQRLANIEVSGTANIFNEDLAIGMINQLPSMGQAPGTFMAVTRKIKTQLDIRAKDKNNVDYGFNEAWGGNVTTFRGIPVVLAEKLSEAETAVS